MARKPDKPPRGKASKVLDRPALVGWRTTDEDEVRLRRWRGMTEIATIEALEPEQRIFGAFRVPGSGASGYEVEVRSLTAPLNSCGCIDHRVNGLGTCKHIEGVLAALRRRGVRAYRQAAIDGPARVEVFLARDGEPRPVVAWPAGGDESGARAWLAPWLTEEGALTADPAGIEDVLAAWAEAPVEIRRAMRVSRHFTSWLERQRRRRSRQEARAAFLAEETGRGSLDVLKHPLLPYQTQGMLHLAFGERALLADEMGLG